MLEKIAERHDEWVELARKLGSPAHMAEDVVQECYLRLNQYTAPEKILTPDGEVNMFYMFVTVRNTLRMMAKQNSVYVPVEKWIFEEEDYDVDDSKEEAYSKLMMKIKDEANSWGPYHSKLFNLYYMTDHSMRDIAKGTDIGLTHIYNNLKSYKEIIIDKCGEDYSDYLNEDYDRI